MLAPQQLDEPVAAHRLAAGQQQQTQHGPLPWAAEVERLGPVPRRQLAEQAHPQPTPAVHVPPSGLAPHVSPPAPEAPP
jgi:hypothetical protein